MAVPRDGCYGTPKFFDGIMTPERFRQIDEVFQQALDQSPAQRTAFLESACGGDTALRDEVRELLLSPPSLPSTGIPHSVQKDITAGIKELAMPPPSSGEGRRIGNYRVLSLLGRGGMGAVYLAIRDNDFQQQVAIKLVRGGMDSEGLLRRFRYERQLLAF